MSKAPKARIAAAVGTASGSSSAKGRGAATLTDEALQGFTNQEEGKRKSKRTKADTKANDHSEIPIYAESMRATLRSENERITKRKLARRMIDKWPERFPEESFETLRKLV